MKFLAKEETALTRFAIVNTYCHYKYVVTLSRWLIGKIVDVWV